MSKTRNVGDAAWPLEHVSEETHSPAACMLAGPMYLTWKQPRLGRVEYQAWFCQQLGLEPPCLAPYAGQHCSCGRFTIDADHLHTCKQHSDNWYAAHERLLTVVEEIVRAAGLRTKRRYVASSRGSRRCDLEVRDANVADKAHLIIDVAMVHEFHGACDDTVAMARLGMRRTPTACSLTLPSRRSATRRFLLPASVTRRCRVRPSLCTSDGGAAPPRRPAPLQGADVHASLCRRTSMRTGVADRLALVLLLR